MKSTPNTLVRSFAAAAIAIAFHLAFASQARAITWNEVGDAPDSLPSVQNITDATGSQMVQLKGTLSSGDVDLYGLNWNPVGGIAVFATSPQGSNLNLQLLTMAGAVVLPSSVTGLPGGGSTTILNGSNAPPGTVAGMFVLRVTSTTGYTGAYTLDVSNFFTAKKPDPTAGCCAEWIQRSPLNPSPSVRQHHTMAYDSARGRTVLFGGDGAGYLGDTWEWDGASWTQAATTGPSARNESAMAYDSARGVVVLFGGGQNNNPQTNSDTWEWDGIAWTLRATTGPSARVRHAMAYDSSRGVVVLFGGLDASGGGGALVAKGDTWEWNGTAWTLRATTGPAARTSHAIAYDKARGRTVLFGGFGASVFGDTWEWDGTAWTQVATTGPTARYDHAMAYAGGCGHTLLFAGYDQSPPTGRVDDTWDWDGTTWTRLPAAGPSARNGHKMAYDSLRRRFVLFGGYALPAGQNGETWEFNSAIMTTFCAGLKDSFSLVTVDPTPFRRPLLNAYPAFAWGSFDETAQNKHVGQSFTGLPAGIVAAELEIRMKPLDGLSNNDSVNLGLKTSPANTFAWGRQMATLPGGAGWLTNPATTFIFDLSALPNLSGPATNLLPKLIADGLLDVLVQDDTSVDYMCLRVWTCPPHCVTPPRSLALWLPLDEAAGPTARNAAGGNNGTHVGGPVVINQYVANGLQFNGSAYVNVPDYPAINPGTGPLSIDAWVKRDPASGNNVRIIADKRHPISGVGYSLSVSFSNLIYSQNDGSGQINYRDTGIVPADNQWHFVAVTVTRPTTSATAGQFYVDGAPTGTFNSGLPAGSLSNTGTFQVGRSPIGGSNPWLGGLDEVEFFRRVLRPDEVLSLYNAGKLGKCKSYCSLPWDRNFCGASTQKVVGTIHNSAGVTQTFNYSFQGLPAMPNAHPPCPSAGPTVFTPSSGSITVLPGQTVNVPVTIAHHVGNAVGCYQMVVQAAGSNETFTCTGSVFDSLCCHTLPNLVSIGTGVGVLVPISATNLGATPISLPYQISVQTDEMQPDQEAVRLNGLPPGTPVLGTLTLAPGASTVYDVGVEFLLPDPLRAYTLLVEADLNGDGELEPVGSAMLVNVIPEGGVNLVSAVSRKTHGTSGDFDIPLPLSGTAGIECRRGPVATSHTLVLTFNNPVLSGSASVTAGIGSVSLTNPPTFSGNEMTVNLEGVNDPQTLTVSLTNVMDIENQALPSASVNLSVLFGDANGSGVVNSTDIVQVKAASGQTVVETNFRKDVNASGVINSTDIVLTKAKSGSALP